MSNQHIEYDYDTTMLNQREIDEVENILNKNKMFADKELVFSKIKLNGTIPRRISEYIWVESLDLTGCCLSSLENLPPNIINLILDDNMLKTLGDIDTMIPDNVQVLSADNNFIEKIYKLPNKLAILNLSSNSLTNIDCPIPPNLEMIKLSCNSFTEIPILGDGVKEINISSNKLASLKNLSGSVTSLDCSDNTIMKIDEPLPKNLAMLSISNNLLKYVGAGVLSDSIESLDLSHNYITRIIELPKKLMQIDVSENRLEYFPFNDLPVYLTYLNVKDNGNLHIPEYVKKIAQLVLECSKDDEPENNYGYGYNSGYYNYGYNNNYNGRNDYNRYGGHNEYDRNNYNRYGGHNEYGYSRHYSGGYNNYDSMYHNNEYQKPGKYNSANSNYIIMTKKIEI